MGKHEAVYEMGICGMLKNLTVTEYEIQEETNDLRQIVIRMAKHPDPHVGKWEVRMGRMFVLCKTPDDNGVLYFDFPTAAFNASQAINEYRFETAQAAFDFWQANHKRLNIPPKMKSG